MVNNFLREYILIYNSINKVLILNFRINMKPYKVGQVVKFHTSNPDEDPEQLYVVTEIKRGKQKDRVDIKALNTGLTFPPTPCVLLDDLTIVEVSTKDLIGQSVIIEQPDHTQVRGTVINTQDDKINLDMDKTPHGVKTNVYLTVMDKNGFEHYGTLVVKPKHT